MPCWPILQGMLKEEASLINYDSPSLIAKTPDHSPSSPPIFILCDKCFGAQLMWIRLEYRGRIGAHSVMRIIMN